MAKLPQPPPQLPFPKPKVPIDNTMHGQKFDQFTTPITWRDITFPITNLHTNLQQRLIAHEYPDRDAAHVESTGRKSLIISCTAVFYNHIKPYNGEKWKAGDLFPKTYKQFLSACADDSVGVLNHPILGKLSVKCQGINTTLDANVRGGATVDVSWIETLTIPTQISNPAANINAQGNALIAELNAVPIIFLPQLPMLPNIFALLNSVTALINSVALMGTKLFNTITKIQYQLNLLVGAIDRLNTAILGNLKQKALLLNSSLNQLIQQLNSKLGKTKTYIVQVDSNMGELVRVLQNDIRTLLQLNPLQASHPVIKAGTAIKYIAAN